MLPTRRILHYYYETESQISGLTVAVADCQAVRKVLMDRFESVAELEENTGLAVSSKIENNELHESLNEIDCFFEKAFFNTEANFGPLQNAIVDCTDVSHSVFYGAQTAYEEFKKAVREFGSGRKIFLAAHMARQPRSLTPKRILLRLERQQEP